MIPPTFVHREQEIADLNRLTRPDGPALILVYGRRRVGKTSLLRHWAGLTGLPAFYWESPRSTADNVRTSLVRELWAWSRPGPGAPSPRYDNWDDVFQTLRQEIGDRPALVILDEFPWAVEADAALPSHLKKAWDHLFPGSQIKLLFSGSHISAMEKLLLSDAPLFGRMTGKLLVRPFPFVQIQPFVPRYSPEKRLAVYAILGGIPDYLRRWDDRADLLANIREIFLSELSPYRNESEVLISDVLRRDSPDYEAVLGAVGRGQHAMEDICTGAMLPGHRAAHVLGSLVEVRLVERRIRASIPLSQHGRARHARYHLADPFLQFYYRFVAPNRSQIAQGLYERIEQQFREQLRAFVGAAFEELCRTWTLVQARNGGLPFAPDFVGSDWGPQHQADVAAVNWSERRVLVGEAKWTDQPVDHGEWRTFLARAEKVVGRLRAADPARKARQPAPLGPGEPAPWERHLLLFTRHGATPAVEAAASGAAARVITFAEIVHDLERLPDKPIR